MNILIIRPETFEYSFDNYSCENITRSVYEQLRRNMSKQIQHFQFHPFQFKVVECERLLVRTDLPTV